MRNSTLIRKALTLVAAIFVSILTAQAGEQTYAYFYDTFKAYPTGAGKVYIDDESSASETLEYKGTSAPSGVVAVPAEGWIFAGWGKVNEQTGAVEEVSSRDNVYYGLGSITAKTEYEEEPVDEESAYPLEPDTTVFAIFSHVVADAAYLDDSQQYQVGSTTVEPFVNTETDQVQVTAVPSAEYQSTFTYWELPDGTQSTENPIATTGEQAALYIAHFETPFEKVIEPTETGLVELWFPNKELSFLDDNIHAINISSTTYVSEDYINEDGEEATRYVTAPNFSQTVIDTTAAYIAWGYEATIARVTAPARVLYSPELAEDPGAPYADWSGETGLKVAELDGAYEYYYFVNALPAYFQHVSETETIPANRTVLRINKTDYETILPEDKLYLGNYDAQAAHDGTEEDAIHAMSANAQRQHTIYTLDGRAAADTSKPGLYIIDRQKVIIKR